MQIWLLFDLIPTDYSTARGSPAVIQDPSPQYDFYISPGILDGIVRVVFIAPDKGRVTVNLMNANDDILIQIDTRFDWNTWTNTVVLNSKRADGEWGQEVQAETFPFRCCGSYNNIYVEIRESAFIISANGADVASYPYRENLGPPVDVVVYNFEDNDASMKAQYTGTGVYYY